MTLDNVSKILENISRYKEGGFPRVISIEYRLKGKLEVSKVFFADAKSTAEKLIKAGATIESVK